MPVSEDKRQHSSDTIGRFVRGLGIYGAIEVLTSEAGILYNVNVQLRERNDKGLSLRRDMTMFGIEFYKGLRISVNQTAHQ